MIGNAEVPGLYLLAAHDMFSIINSGQSGENLKVWVSFFEIYCGSLFDLLNKRNRYESEYKRVLYRSSYIQNHLSG